MWPGSFLLLNPLQDSLNGGDDVVVFNIEDLHCGLRLNETSLTVILGG